jgi:hypothetical protein
MKPVMASLGVSKVGISSAEKSARASRGASSPSQLVSTSLLCVWCVAASLRAPTTARAASVDEAEDALFAGLPPEAAPCYAALTEAA